MPRARYRKGERIRSMEELAAIIEEGSRRGESGALAYLNDKPQNRGWLMNMSYHSLRFFVLNGRAWRAARKENHGER